MADMEAVVKNLEDLQNIMVERQEVCPKEELQYWIEMQESLADAVILLKEQHKIVRCRDCKHYHHGYCCDLLQKPIMSSPDYYCADGER